MHMHSTVYSSNMYSISMLHTLATNCAMNCTTFGSPRNCQISITTFSICTLPLLSLPNTSSTKLGGEWWKMRFRLYVKILRSSTQRFTMHESHLDLNVSASLSTGFVLIVDRVVEEVGGGTDGVDTARVLRTRTATKESKDPEMRPMGVLHCGTESCAVRTRRYCRFMNTVVRYWLDTVTVHYSRNDLMGVIDRPTRVVFLTMLYTVSRAVLVLYANCGNIV